ncbi:MAG: single-stranded DNA-binding protein [Bacteroidota bacterium]
MNGVNVQILIGNLGKAADIRYMEGNRGKASFGVATNKSYTNREGQQITNTSWHNVVVWDPSLVDVAQKYCTKGRQVIVEGESTTRSYEDREGNTQYVREVKATKLLPIDQIAQEGKGLHGNFIAGTLVEKPQLQRNDAGESTCQLLFKQEKGHFPVELTGRQAEVATQYLDANSVAYVKYEIVSTEPFKAQGTNLVLLGQPSSARGETKPNTSQAGTQAEPRGNTIEPQGDSSNDLDDLPF